MDKLDLRKRADAVYIHFLDFKAYTRLRLNSVDNIDLGGTLGISLCGKLFYKRLHTYAVVKVIRVGNLDSILIVREKTFYLLLGYILEGCNLCSAYKLNLSDSADVVFIGNADTEAEAFLTLCRVGDCKIGSCLCKRGDGKLFNYRLITRAVVEVVDIGHLDGVLVVGEQANELSLSKRIRKSSAVCVDKLDLGNGSHIVRIGLDDLKVYASLCFSRIENRNFGSCLCKGGNCKFTRDSMLTLTVIKVICISNSYGVLVVRKKISKRSLIERSCRNCAVCVNKLNLCNSTNVIRICFGNRKAYRGLRACGGMYRDFRYCLCICSKFKINTLGFICVRILSYKLVSRTRKQLIYCGSACGYILYKGITLVKFERGYRFPLMILMPKIAETDILLSYRDVIKEDYRIGIKRILVKNVLFKTAPRKVVIISDYGVLIKRIGFKSVKGNDIVTKSNILCGYYAKSVVNYSFKRTL